MRLYHLYLSTVSLLAMVDVGRVPLLGETSQGSSKEAWLYFATDGFHHST